MSGRGLKAILREFLIKWFLWLGVWSSMGLSFGYQSYVHASKVGSPVGLMKHLMWGLEDWYLWGAFSLPIIELARRLPIERENWRKAVGIHLLVSLAAAPVYQVLRSAICGMEHLTIRQPLPYLLVYWMILAIWHAWHWHRELYEKEVREADMERRMVEAQLMALQMQLNPHFLFNTLNAISSLMRRDVEAADKMMVKLSELLREALDHSKAQESSLETELDFLQRYVDIEKMRFGDRLEYEADVPDEVRKARVPSLILQPLVENAIRHGVEPNARSGRIRLSVERQNGSLCLQVRDNGNGIKERGNGRQGIGITNTRSRLQGLYGNRHRFDIRNHPEGGTEVAFEIPYHTRDMLPKGTVDQLS